MAATYDNRFIHSAGKIENRPLGAENRGVNRGKLAVGAMLLSGVLLAAFALWWNVTSGSRTLEFWGTDAGRRIIDERATVELLWLRPASGGSQERTLDIGSQPYAIVATADVTGARGLVHARHSLLEDASYAWTEHGADQARYELAVRFRNDAGTTTAAFDFTRPQIAHVESGRNQRAAAKIVAGWKQFAQRHAPQETGLRPSDRVKMP